MAATGDNGRREIYDTRRKRLVFRAWHRGIRETDLILGRFADASVRLFDDDDMNAFEALLDLPDRDILGWVTGSEDIPEDMASPMLDRIIAFHRG